MELNPLNWIGIDVGGANIKLSDAEGRATAHVFPLWKKREDLADAIRALIAEHKKSFPETSWDGIALTMTGELADCYSTKAEGVANITAATVMATEPLPIQIATVDDRWLSPTEAIAEPTAVAAANWRLMARQVANQMGEEITTPALLIDIGSTTADLIPIQSGQVISRGKTDIERLLHQELIYTGVRRTPICSLVSELPYRGQSCPTATEWFATTADVWLLLGELKESEADLNTADGRSLTIPFAIDRLARCICADRTSFTLEDAQRVAEYTAKVQTELLAKAIRFHDTTNVFVSGEGEFLARRAIELLNSSTKVVSLSNVIGQKASECGPAFAAAYLANSECRP